MNIEKIHNIVAWSCFPLAGIGFFIGGEYGIDAGAKILFKVLGLYMLVYCLKCIKVGKEDFITITWSSGVVTKEGNPVLFWFAMGLLFSTSIVFLFF